MARKAQSSKVPKPSGRVKIGSILNFKKHGNSEEEKKIIQPFKDYGLMKCLTFDYQAVQKEEVLEWYLIAKIYGV